MRIAIAIATSALALVGSACGGSTHARTGDVAAREAIPAPVTPLFASPDEPARATRPAPLGEATFPELEVHETTLPNGLTVIVSPRRELPIVGVAIASRTLTPLDANGPPGIASLLSRVIGRELERAAETDPEGEDRDPPEISVGNDGARIFAEVPARSLARAIRTLSAVVLARTCDPRDVELTRISMREDARASLYTPGGFSRLVQLRMLYGQTDRRGLPWFGSAELVESGGTAQCGWARERAFAPSETAIVIVGDVTPADALAAAQSAFGSWSAVAPTLAIEAPTFPPPTPRLVVVPTGSDQADIRLMERGPGVADADYPAFVVLTRLLGGMFVSRLNLSLREERGYSYGVTSELYTGSDHTVLEVATVVAAAHAAETVAEVVAEMLRLRSGAAAIESVELETARALERARLVHSVETCTARAHTLGRLFQQRLPVAWLARTHDALGDVDASGVASVAQRWLRADRAPMLVIARPRLVADSLARAMPGEVAVVEVPR